MPFAQKDLKPVVRWNAIWHGVKSTMITFQISRVLELLELTFSSWSQATWKKLLEEQACSVLQASTVSAAAERGQQWGINSSLMPNFNTSETRRETDSRFA